MVIRRGWATLLIAVAGWNWLIWPRFATAIYNDDRAWSGATGEGPTEFLWIHALIILVSLAIGTTLGALGIKAWRATTNPKPSPEPTAQ